MTPDSSDPSLPKGNPESVLGSDSALGLVPPPEEAHEEVSEGSSIFDHGARAKPQSASDGALNLLQGSREFVLPGEELSASHDEAPETSEPAPEPASEPVAETPAEPEPAPVSAENAATAEMDITFVRPVPAEPPVEETVPTEAEAEALTESPSEDAIAESDESQPEPTEEAPAAPTGEALPSEGEAEAVTEAAEDDAPAWAEAAEQSPAEPADAEPASATAEGEAPAEDDSSALAAFGGLAAGAALGAEVGNAWGEATNSTASSDTPSYRPAPLAAPKRDLVKTLLISYAVLVTLAAGILWKRLADKNFREQTLESLPDTRTLKVGQVSVFDTDSTLPPGHTLKLGEKRRFGNLEVEAFKVTRGMVSFENPETNWTPSPEGPLVKLWLRFRNVSDTQPIPPLDKYLVFTQTRKGNSDHFATNNFLKVAGTKDPFGYILRHDHSDRSVLKDQQLDIEIPPGGTLETFIPTQPELELPKGELVWRVHFRKGFGPRGTGVTTLVDITFAADDVTDDGARVSQLDRSDSTAG